MSIKQKSTDCHSSPLQIERPGERVREHGLGHPAGGGGAATDSSNGGRLQEPLSKAVKNPALGVVAVEV